MKKINIFGGTGFIGTHLCERLGGRAVLIPRQDLVPLHKDSIYLISTTDNYNVYENVNKDIDTNLTALVNTLELLEKGDTFNFISSWFVYGNQPLPVDESSNCNPKGFYSITKRCAEQLVISYCTTFGINYRILRLANVYGPGDTPTPRKNALQYLIELIREGETVKLYNGGEFYRDYIHVKDVARAIELCADKGPLNEIINIGSGQKYKFCDIINLVCRQMKTSINAKNCEVPKFHQTVQVKDFYMKTSKLKALGFKEDYTLERGIRELVK